MLGPLMTRLISIAGSTQRRAEYVNKLRILVRQHSQRKRTRYEICDDIGDLPPFPPLLQQSSQTRTRTRWRAHRPIRPCRGRPQSCSPQSRRCQQRWTPRLQRPGNGIHYQKASGNVSESALPGPRGKASAECPVQCSMHQLSMSGRQLARASCRCKCGVVFNQHPPG